MLKNELLHFHTIHDIRPSLSSIATFSRQLVSQLFLVGIIKSMLNRLKKQLKSNLNVEMIVKTMK
jgi:hypothetical protein